MIRLQRSLAVLAAGLVLATSTASVAGTRPGSSVPMVSKAVTGQMVSRASKRVTDVNGIKPAVTGTQRALFILLGVGAAAAAVMAVAGHGSKDSRG